MTHWQETGECSICGAQGSGNDGVKLMCGNLDSTPFVIPFTDGVSSIICYYLCPKCKSAIEEGVGYRIRVESKREKIKNLDIDRLQLDINELADIKTNKIPTFRKVGNKGIAQKDE